MRIALYCHKFWPAVGGLCTYTGHLCTYLVERGHDVRVFTTHSPSDAPAFEQVTKGLVVRRFAQALGSHPPYLFMPGLLKLATSRDVRGMDVVHTVGYYFFGTAFGHFSAMTSGVPHVSTPVYTLNPSTWQRRTFDAILGRRLVARASHVIPQSPGELELLRRDDFRVNAHTIVPFGVDSDLFRENYDVDDLRRRYAIEPSDTVLLFVGKVMSPKGAFDALDVVATLRRQGRRLRLVLLGNVHERERELFASRISEHDLTSSVVLPGAITDRREIARHYQLADVVLFPSAYEQFGIVAVEAGASGRPLIGTPVGIMQTLVPQYQYGLLHPFGDRERFAKNLTDVLDSPHYRDNAARHRAEFLDQYDWRTIAARTEDIYTQVSAARRRPRTTSAKAVL